MKKPYKCRLCVKISQRILILQYMSRLDSLAQVPPMCSQFDLRMPLRNSWGTPKEHPRCPWSLQCTPGIHFNIFYTSEAILVHISTAKRLPIIKDKPPRQYQGSSGMFLDIFCTPRMPLRAFQVIFVPLGSVSWLFTSKMRQ